MWFVVGVHGGWWIVGEPGWVMELVHGEVDGQRILVINGEWSMVNEPQASHEVPHRETSGRQLHGFAH